MDQYQCKRCDQSVAVVDKEEHDDWHFAKDLADQDGGSGSNAQSSLPVPPSDPSLLKKPADKMNQNDYAPPSYPPPPAQTNGAQSRVSSSATNGRPTQRYMNVVDRAAELRARDEVRSPRMTV